MKSRRPDGLEILEIRSPKVKGYDYATLITSGIGREGEEGKEELSDVKKTRSDVPDRLQKPFQELQPQIVSTVTVATQMLLLNFSNKYNFSFIFFSRGVFFSSFLGKSNTLKT